MHSRCQSAWWWIDGARCASATIDSNIRFRSRLVTIRIKPARLHVPGVYNVTLAWEGIVHPRAGKEKRVVILTAVLALSSLKNTSLSWARASDIWSAHLALFI